MFVERQSIKGIPATKDVKDVESLYCIREDLSVRGYYPMKISFN